MGKTTLSIFIDESGDFGVYDDRSPFYLVAMVLHNQKTDITRNINSLEKHLHNLGYEQHALHTGPLIRRESIYKNDFMTSRKQLFNALFNFTRKLEVQYICTMLKKNECPDAAAMIAKLSRSMKDTLDAHHEYMEQFDRIIVYYDNGQTELTKTLTSVFYSIFSHVEFRKVHPADYKLFQVADLICTVELLAQKTMKNGFSRSEIEFFHSEREFKKNYLKPLRKKQL